MAKQTERRSTGRRPGLKEGQARKRNCYFCRLKIEDVDYKDLNQLRRFISEKGKIRSRRITGSCRRHQVQIARAVKRARELALLPYVNEGGRDDEREGGGGRGRRGRD